MATLMSDEVFHDVAYKAKNRNHLLAGIDEFLDAVTVLPPGEWDPAIRIEPPAAIPSQVKYTWEIIRKSRILYFHNQPYRSICSGCKEATKRRETEGRPRRRSRRAEVEGRIRSLENWQTFRWLGKRHKEKSAVLYFRLQGRVSSSMRSLFYLPVFCLPLAYNYIRWFAERSHRQKYGRHGVARFRFRLRHRIWTFLWSTSHHSRFHRPGLSLRDDSLRILQVSRFLRRKRFRG